MKKLTSPTRDFTLATVFADEGSTRLRGGREGEGKEEMRDVNEMDKPLFLIIHFVHEQSEGMTVS
jgi:hypothetical protein